MNTKSQQRTYIYEDQCLHSQLWCKIVENFIHECIHFQEYISIFMFTVSAEFRTIRQMFLKNFLGKLKLNVL